MYAKQGSGYEMQIFCVFKDIRAMKVKTTEF